MAAMNVAQYGHQAFTWDPVNRVWSGGMQMTAPGYLTTLLQYRDLVRSGQAKDYEAEQYRNWEAQARALPTRDIGSLQAAWQGDLEGLWTEGGYQSGNKDWWTSLDPGSPDAGPIMLMIADKMDRGQASPQERALFQQVMGMASDWNYRASVPQASDSPIGLGDNLFGALSMIGLGAGAGASLAPLATTGLTVGSAAGLAGTAGSLAGMMGQALDEKGLAQAGGILGLLGGAGGIANLLSQGVTSVGDLLSLAQKGWGAAQKGMNLAASFGGDGGTKSQQSSGTSSGGQGMDFSQLGTILSGIVGAVGSGLSLDDASRYMNQLKQLYGDEGQTRQLLDEAYNLAKARYDTYYAQTQEQYQEKKAVYEQAKQKYDTAYTQSQQQWGQQQEAYQTMRGQEAEDRGLQRTRDAEQYAKSQQNFAEREAQARQERDLQLSTWGVDRQMVIDAYNRKVQEAAQDRDREMKAFEEDRGRYLGRDDERAAQARQDRAFERQVFGEDRARVLGRDDERAAQARQDYALDVAGTQARHGIGANLADPTRVMAGAEALYNPLSELARTRIAQNTEADMARRGVTGGGMYANRLSAEAYAPEETKLWQTALQGYLTSQNQAISAYAPTDLTLSPEYQYARVPDFATTPEFRPMNMPDFAQTPNYTPLNMPNLQDMPTYMQWQTPSFIRANPSAVPGAPTLPGMPGVPEATNPYGAPRPDTWQPKPYSPYEGKTKGISDLVTNLTKALGGNAGAGSAASGLIGLIQKLISGSTTAVPASFLSWGGNETQQPWYDPSAMDWGYDEIDFDQSYVNDFANIPNETWDW